MLNNLICYINSQKFVVNSQNTNNKPLSENLSQKISNKSIKYYLNIHDLNSHLIDTNQTIYNSFIQALNECGIVEQNQINILLESSNINEFIEKFRDPNFANARQDKFVQKIIQKPPFCDDNILKDKLYANINDSRTPLKANLVRRLYDINYKDTPVFSDIIKALDNIENYAQQNLSDTYISTNVISNVSQRNVDSIKHHFNDCCIQNLTGVMFEERNNPNYAKPNSNYIDISIQRALNININNIKDNLVLVMYGDSLKNDGGTCINLAKQGYNTIFVLHDTEDIYNKKISQIEKMATDIPIFVVKRQDKVNMELAGGIITDSIKTTNSAII